MHGIARNRRLPEHQLIDKGHHHKAAAEAEQHRGNAGSKACQRNNNDLIQEYPRPENERAAYTGRVLLPICVALNYLCKSVRGRQVCAT